LAYKTNLALYGKTKTFILNDCGLGFKFEGLWLGMISGNVVQTIMIIIYSMKINWTEKAEMVGIFLKNF
jgi:Na+-driven multidrug efflux pump